MTFKEISLQNFRSYKKASFTFNPRTTILIGLNTAGKTNLMEGIWMLSTGKSFRIDKDIQMIKFGEEVASIKGLIEDSGIADNNTGKTMLEVMLAQGSVTAERFVKKYTVNAIPKRRADFGGRLPAILFSPEELDIISAGPSQRRKFLDDVLEQIDSDYRHAKILYEKALRQRNALLDIAKETGKRITEQFTYWDALLITNGSSITKKREAFIGFLNAQKKDIFACRLVYDRSTISEERLLQYKDAEAGAGVTLVGPHRDDILIYMNDHEVKYFGSRGQQRLAVLQLKLLQLQYIEQALGEKPLLLLDDIFSELDEKHMNLVLSMTTTQQTIMTTTHKEFINEKTLKNAKIIDL